MVYIFLICETPLFFFNIMFASCVFFFQNVHTFQTTIRLCYNWQNVALQNKVPFLRTWVVVEVVVKVLL
jgi:hypothetical protein